MEALPIISAFITIIRAVRDIYKKYNKPEEAKALEKAAETIEAKKGIPEDEAKGVFVKTITEELGKEKASPVIEYTNSVAMFFPVRPEGAILDYGTKIKELAEQIQKTLDGTGAFKLYGRPQFPRTSSAIKKLSPLELECFMEEKLGGLRILVNHKGLVEDCHVEVPVSDPLLLFFVTRSGNYVLGERLDAKSFSLLMDALIQDARDILELVAKETQQSRHLAEKLSGSIAALKEISSSSGSDKKQ